MLSCAYVICGMTDFVLSCACVICGMTDFVLPCACVKPRYNRLGAVRISQDLLSRDDLFSAAICGSGKELILHACPFRVTNVQRSDMGCED